MRTLLLIAALAVPAFAVEAPKPDSSKIVQSEEPLVVFSKDTRKFHTPKCKWARRCKKNCVTLPLSEAQKRGVPCKLCRGGLPEIPGEK